MIIANAASTPRVVEGYIERDGYKHTSLVYLFKYSHEVKLIPYSLLRQIDWFEPRNLHTELPKHVDDAHLFMQKVHIVMPNVGEYDAYMFRVETISGKNTAFFEIIPSTYKLYKS